jgi:hypothetical protein
MVASGGVNSGRGRWRHLAVHGRGAATPTQVHGASVDIIEIVERFGAANAGKLRRDFITLIGGAGGVFGCMAARRRSARLRLC